MAEIALQNENDELRLALGKVEEMLRQSQRKSTVDHSPTFYS
jgi:hypothetical protein